MKNIYEYIERIRTRPWIYLAQLNISSINQDLLWYSGFILFNDLKVDKFIPFRMFHEYISYKYNYWLSTTWWRNILIEKYWDNKEWLDKFFEHLDNFKELFWNMSQEEIIAWFDERGYDVRSRFEEKY